MSTEIDVVEPEVNLVERVEVTPSDDDELVEGHPDSSQGEEEGDDEEISKKPDELVQRKPATVPPKTPPAPVEGETPRERALRHEVERLRGENRKVRSEELLGTPPATQAKLKELTPEKASVLAKYKPEEISSLREVLPVLAEEMGYVRQDQLGAQTYQTTANEALNDFLTGHPEYLPENDKDNVLWTRFSEEYKNFKQPENPKMFSKIFERVHREVMGIQPAANLAPIKAAQEKVKVASHAGAPSSTGINRPGNRPASKTGLRTDMLKGFSDKEIAELEGSDDE